MRAAGRKAREELPTQPKAASWAQVEAALRATRCINTSAAILLAWQTAARVGCVAQLRRNDVILHEADNSLSVTFLRGKGALMRQQAYTVHTPPIPSVWVQLLKSFLDGATGSLFPTPTDWGAKVRVALRAVDASLEQRSLRRGALQALALAPGMTDAVLLLFSGHSSVLTLRRYLNWGVKAAHTRTEMMATAGTALNRVAPGTLRTSA